MLRISNRKGFAMPMAIFVIAVLTAALAAGFSGTTTEFTTNTAVRAQNRAYQFAEAGLEAFMVRRGESGWCLNCVTNPALADSEWTRVSMTGGYADVVAVRVRPMIGAANALYFIRSKGTDTVAKLNPAAGTKYAERTVGIYATWNTTTMSVLAAWTSLSGLNKNGTGVISGVDQCGMMPDVAGVLVPKNDLHVQGNSFHPDGSPPVDTSNTFLQLKPKVNIDWASIVQQNSLAPDITIPGGSFPSSSTFNADTNYWPVIRIKSANYSLPNKGRGIIIADSNFTISGSNMWDGIILVGGQLTSNGNNTTAGATLSGLNFLLGGTPSTSSVDDSDANGQKSYVYDSCNVSSATQRLRRYTTMPNSWMDNLASW